MGRKQARKRERRAVQRTSHGRWNGTQGAGEPNLDLFDDDELLAMLPMFARDEPLAVGRACGGCREFLEDREGGRGTCMHPASGVLSPWTDTEACAYWARR
ncbi:MAG: hypothetical protein WD557_08690 [Dehalococcoidia bacterium]